jgi:hypothetical protein
MMKKFLCTILGGLLLTVGQSFALEIVSLTPGRGVPGTTVTMRGGPFSDATQPYLGDQPVTPRQVFADRLEFRVPNLPAGNYRLTVRDGSTAVDQSFQFEILALTPLISDLSPRNFDVCATTAEQRLEVTGQNFQPGAMLLLDDIALPTRFVSPTRLEAELQGFQQAGVYGVKVSNPDGATSLPHSLWVDGIPEISSVSQGAAFPEHYEVIIQGKNFLPNSILVVKEPENSLTGQAYRQFSFAAHRRGASGGGAIIAPPRDRLVFVDCRTLVYYRYPTTTQSKALQFSIVNPDGHRTETYAADMP